ncbi:MAG TPA: hypothetical protein VEL76_10025 [Gemmataceae bacterium]|nr:hypothetical protein [Gemmataceae bacterium]
MLRKLLLSAVLATGAFTSLAVTADAQPPSFRHDHRDRHDRVRFEVMYRHHNHWDCYGTYGDRDDAQRAARHLRQRGFQVRIEVERGR